MMQTPNLIHGLTFDVAYEGSAMSGDALAEWLRAVLLPVVDEVLARQPGRRRIERLELDLGSVDQDEAEEVLARRLFAQLSSALDGAAELAGGTPVAAVKREPEVGDLLLGFLRSGRLAWVVSADPRVAHQELLRKVLGGAGGRAVLKTVVQDRKMLLRLVRQFDAELLAEVAELVHSSRPPPPRLRAGSAEVEAYWLSVLRGESPGGADAGLSAAEPAHLPAASTAQAVGGDSHAVAQASRDARKHPPLPSGAQQLAQALQKAEMAKAGRLLPEAATGPVAATSAERPSEPAQISATAGPTEPAPARPHANPSNTAQPRPPANPSRPAQTDASASPSASAQTSASASPIATAQTSAPASPSATAQASAWASPSAVAQTSASASPIATAQASASASPSATAQASAWASPSAVAQTSASASPIATAQASASASPIATAQASALASPSAASQSSASAGPSAAAQTSVSASQSGLAQSSALVNPSGIAQTNVLGRVNDPAKTGASGSQSGPAQPSASASTSGAAQASVLGRASGSAQVSAPAHPDDLALTNISARLGDATHGSISARSADQTEAGASTHEDDPASIGAPVHRDNPIQARTSTKQSNQVQHDTAAHLDNAERAATSKYLDGSATKNAAARLDGPEASSSIARQENSAQVDAIASSALTQPGMLDQPDDPAKAQASVHPGNQAQAKTNARSDDQASPGVTDRLESKTVPGNSGPTNHQAASSNSGHSDSLTAATNSTQPNVLVGSSDSARSDSSAEPSIPARGDTPAQTAAVVSSSGLAQADNSAGSDGTLYAGIGNQHIGSNQPKDVTSASEVPRAGLSKETIAAVARRGVRPFVDQPGAEPRNDVTNAAAGANSVASPTGGDDRPSSSMPPTPEASNRLAASAATNAPLEAHGFQSDNSPPPAASDSKQSDAARSSRPSIKRQLTHILLTSDIASLKPLLPEIAASYRNEFATLWHRLSAPARQRNLERSQSELSASEHALLTELIAKRTSEGPLAGSAVNLFYLALQNGDAASIKRLWPSITEAHHAGFNAVWNRLSADVRRQHLVLLKEVLSPAEQGSLSVLLPARVAGLRQEQGRDAHEASAQNEAVVAASGEPAAAAPVATGNAAIASADVRAEPRARIDTKAAATTATSAVTVATPDAITAIAATATAIAAAASPDAITAAVAAPRDAATRDAATRDTATRDTATRDAATRDAVAPDAGTRDAATPDAATRDAVAPDAAALDVAAPDAATRDAGTPEAVAAPPVVAVAAAGAAAAIGAEPSAFAIAPALALFRDWQRHKLELASLSLSLADLKQWLNWWLMHDPRLVNQDCSLMLQAIETRCAQVELPELFMREVLTALRADNPLDLDALAAQANRAMIASDRPAAMDPITTLKSQQAIRNFIEQHRAEDAALRNLNAAQLHQLVRAWITQDATAEPSLFLLAIEDRALQAADAHAYFSTILQGILDGRAVDLDLLVMAAPSAWPLSAREAQVEASAMPDAAQPRVEPAEKSGLPPALLRVLPGRLADAFLQADLTPLKGVWAELARAHPDLLRAAAQRYLRRPQSRDALIANSSADMLRGLLQALSPAVAQVLLPILDHAVECNAVLPAPLTLQQFQQRVISFGFQQAMEGQDANWLPLLLDSLSPNQPNQPEQQQAAHAWHAILPASPALKRSLFGEKYLAAVRAYDADSHSQPALHTMLTMELCQTYPELIDEALQAQLAATPPSPASAASETTLAILLMRTGQPDKLEQLAVELQLQRILSAPQTLLSGALESALAQPATIARLAEYTSGPVMAQLLARLAPELAAQLPIALRAISSQLDIANIPAMQNSALWRSIYEAAFVAADPVTLAEFIRTLVQTTAPKASVPQPVSAASTGATGQAGPASQPAAIMQALMMPLTAPPALAEQAGPPELRDGATTHQAEAQDDVYAGESSVLNAGMVIIATYMQRLFSILELTESGRFKSEQEAQRAVHLLQYAVTGQTSTPEYQLVLNKLFCGIHGGEPIAAGIDITDKEKDTIEQMLKGVIAHWSALGKTSVGGLRQTFLRREGQLYFDNDAWHLKIPQATFDMLLDRLPWSFSMIKFPWMPHPLNVTWR
ncbi:hypothetical protein GJ699_06920 [Duganella sp. FT80W]|uniref:Uncharacterized protein n=1 Tax=Duganella guangzhouensis TaxID=2666084 RepID=A0A6I2KW17_9BURK|nr:contractile injection system tape measure protein [Duganella guangzhouensis]MRW89710.1 hypothetical protein [Duganella guangzhouensis]